MTTMSLISRAGDAAVSTTEPTPQALAFAALVIVVIAGLMTFALVKAAKYAQPTLMIVAVALLTLLSLVGLAVSDGEASATFGTLAATGIGALAGAVAGRFGKDGKD